jgi:hypothetical protein
LNHDVQDAALEHAGQRHSINKADVSNYDRAPAIDPEDNQWEVERPIEKRQIGRRVEYLVKWLGYPDNDNSWEKKKDIDSDIVVASEAELKV